MPVYSDPDFSCGTDGRDGTDQPKVVQEVLADLKSVNGGWNNMFEIRFAQILA